MTTPDQYGPAAGEWMTIVEQTSGWRPAWTWEQCFEIRPTVRARAPHGGSLVVSHRPTGVMVAVLETYAEAGDEDAIYYGAGATVAQAVADIVGQMAWYCAQAERLNTGRNARLTARIARDRAVVDWLRGDEEGER